MILSLLNSFYKWFFHKWKVPKNHNTNIPSMNGFYKWSFHKWMFSKNPDTNIPSMNGFYKWSFHKWMFSKAQKLLLAICHFKKERFDASCTFRSPIRTDQGLSLDGRSTLIHLIAAGASCCDEWSWPASRDPVLSVDGWSTSTSPW